MKGNSAEIDRIILTSKLEHTNNLIRNDTSNWDIFENASYSESLIATVP